MREKPQQAKDRQQPETAANLFDLAQGSDWKVSLSNENPQEREYRLQQDSYDSQHRRWRTTILFIVVLIAVSIVLYYCLQILTNPQASNDDKKWATAIAASIVSGGIGFITGSKAVG
jgi:hypothetical protein